MRLHSLSPSEWVKTLAIGVGVSMLTGVIMLIGLRTGLLPLPKSLGLAFANTLLGTSVSKPVGFLFHTLWVTLFSAVYVVLFRDALTFLRAFWLAFALWILTLVVFFPIVGWGFFGLAVTPKLIIASAAAHLLFAVFLWGMCKSSFIEEREGSARHNGSYKPATR